MKIFIEEIFLGTHNWPKAPKEVEFLKFEHHHNFHIRIECNVKHSDRELEFIMLRVWLKNFIDKAFDTRFGIYRFGSKSCEMLGKQVKEGFEEHYGDRKVKVIVSEENYQGGIIE